MGRYTWGRFIDAFTASIYLVDQRDDDCSVINARCLLVTSFNAYTSFVSCYYGLSS